MRNVSEESVSSMPKKKTPGKLSGFGSVVGGSSILVILAVLCMTVFALLSVATVKADVRLTDKQVQSVKEYYEADCKAEEIIGLIREGKAPEGVTKDGDVYSFECPVSGIRRLEVGVRVTGDRCEILYKQMVADSAE